MQQRLESSPQGRVVISLLLVVVVVSVVASGMTNGSLKPSLLRYDQELLALTGLDQRWDIFAPDPRRKVVDIRARVAYADGRIEDWRLPAGAPLVGGGWNDSRWSKWMESVMLLGPRSPVWHGLAAWLARGRAQSAGQRVRVTLVSRYYDQLPPGATSLRGPWRDFIVSRVEGPPFQAPGTARRGLR